MKQHKWPMKNTCSFVANSCSSNEGICIRGRDSTVSKLESEYSPIKTRNWCNNLRGTRTDWHWEKSLEHFACWSHWMGDFQVINLPVSLLYACFVSMGYSLGSYLVQALLKLSASSSYWVNKVSSWQTQIEYIISIDSELLTSRQTWDMKDGEHLTCIHGLYISWILNSFLSTRWLNKIIFWFSSESSLSSLTPNLYTLNIYQLISQFSIPLGYTGNR